MKWCIPKIWNNDVTVFIIGGGASLKSLNLELIHNKNVIGVNDAYTLGDWVDFNYFGDDAWGKTHREAMRQYKGLVVTSNCHFLEADDILCTERRPTGLSTVNDTLTWSGNSGAGAINLAFLLGAKRIVLLGYDMKPAGKENNWHKPFRAKPNLNVYNNFIKKFKILSDDLKEFPEVEIVNANLDSALPFFPFSDYETEVKNA